MQAQTQAQVHAVLAPFRPQHIVELEARAAPFDLARLADELPHAALSLEVKASGDERRLHGTLAISNASPGPLDRGRLPVASLQARVASADLENATLEELRIALAGGGLLEGRGELKPGSFRGTARASRINLRALRSTLRETELSGPLELALTRSEQSVRGTLAQAGMSITADAVRSGNTVDIRSLHATAAGGEVKGTGKVFLTDPVRFEARVGVERLRLLGAELRDHPDQQPDLLFQAIDGFEINRSSFSINVASLRDFPTGSLAAADLRRSFAIDKVEFRTA